MLDPAEPGYEVCDWLGSLHLPLYVPAFHRLGYRSLADCLALTDQRLLVDLQVLPTGHRRRILRSLEALGVVGKEEGEEEEEEWRRRPVLYKRHIFKCEKRATSCKEYAQGNAGAEESRRRWDETGSRTLPAWVRLGAVSDSSDDDDDDDVDDAREEKEDAATGAGMGVNAPPVPAPRVPLNIKRSSPTQSPAPAPPLGSSHPEGRCESALVSPATSSSNSSNAEEIPTSETFVC